MLRWSRGRGFGMQPDCPSYADSDKRQPVLGLHALDYHIKHAMSDRMAWALIPVVKTIFTDMICF